METPQIITEELTKVLNDTPENFTKPSDTPDIITSSLSRDNDELPERNDLSDKDVKIFITYIELETKKKTFINIIISIFVVLIISYVYYKYKKPTSVSNQSNNTLNNQEDFNYKTKPINMEEIDISYKYLKPNSFKNKVWNLQEKNKKNTLTDTEQYSDNSFMFNTLE